MDGLFVNMNGIPYTSQESVYTAMYQNGYNESQQQLQQAGNIIAGLQNQNNQLQQDNQSLVYHAKLQNARIQELETEKARIKLERKERSRSYSFNEFGQGVCIEPSGVHKVVGMIQIASKCKYRVIDYDSYRDMLYIRYFDSKGIERYTVIPEDKLAGKNLVKYFEGFYYICKSIDIANGFLAWYIEITPTTETRFIPGHAGFSTFTSDEKEMAEFICDDGTIPIELIPYISENISKKTLTRQKQSIENIVLFSEKYLNTTQKCLLFAFHICGLLSSMLTSLNAPITQILTINSPNPQTTKQACYYLKLYSREKPVLTFESNKATLRKEFHGAKDETVVIEDSGINQDDKHLKILLQNILTFDRDSETQPHNTAIISPFAAYIIPENQKICMTLDYDFYMPMTVAEETELCHALDCITNVVINTICADYSGFKNDIKRLIQYAKELDFFSLLNADSANSYAVLYAVIQKLKKFFCVDISNDDFKNILIQAQEEVEITNGCCDDAIVNDFMDVLNEAVHSGKLAVIINSRHTEFTPCKPQILIKDNLVLIEREVIQNQIIPQMNTAETVHQIQTSTKKLNLLHATKDNCYTSTIYINGKSKIHTFIAFKLDILDDYSQLIVKENGNKEWFSDVLGENTVPVCVNSFGQYSMQDFNYENDSNLHCFVTGMSGSGKTLYLTERMVSLHKQRNRVVVFDTSSSFTRSEIIRKLSVGGDEKVREEVGKYVDENISFYDAENEIPVNLLKFGHSGSDMKLTRDISAIMMSHIPNMGKKQIATLNTAISELVEEKKITLLDLCEKLLEDSINESLSVEIRNMLYIFIEARLSERSWEEFFTESKGIIVISSDAATGSDGSSLVDMMLMSLYLNQRNNPAENLVVFVDEIQNQNMNKESPITKILREGRKLHISFNFATQFMSGNSDTAKLVKNAGTCVYLQPDDMSAKTVAKELMISVKDITEMEQGECYIKGNLINFSSGTSKVGKVHGRTYRNFVK